MAVIELPDEQAAALKAKAAAAGLTLEAWLKKLAEDEVAAWYRRHIADVIRENMRNHGDHAQGRRKPTRSLHLRLAQARGVTALFPDTFSWIALVYIRTVRKVHAHC
jgi:hypothetical protein